MRATRSIIRSVLATVTALALLCGTAAAPSLAATTKDESAPAGLRVDTLLNRTVIGADGERIGKITDVVLDADGNARLLVIQSGGFLGIGAKPIGVDIRLARIRPAEDAITLKDVTQASVRDMPEYRYDDSTASLNHGPPHNPDLEPKPAPVSPPARPR